MKGITNKNIKWLNMELLTVRKLTITEKKEVSLAIPYSG